MQMAKGGVISRFRQLFAGIGGGGKAGDAAQPGDTVTFQQLEFEQRLRQLAHRNATLMTANVHVLGLNRIRKHFEDRWSLVADRVDAIVRRIIEKHLGEEGAYYCYQALTYIIVFGGGSKEAGRVRVALMAEEISRRLFGQANDGSMIETKVAIIRKGEAIDYENLDAATIVARTVEQELKDHITEVLPPSESAAVERLAGAGSPVAPAKKELSTLAEPHWEDMHNPRADSGGEPVAGGEGEHATAEPLPYGEPPPNDWASTSPYATGTLEFVYQPMWLVRQRAVSAYITVPVRVTATGGLLFGPDAIPTGTNSSLNIELDMASLRHIVHSLAKKGGRHRQFISCVHFITLTEGEHRQRFQAFTRQLPAGMKEGIIFELVGLPKGTPQTRLYDVLPLLRANNPAVLLRLPLDTQDFDRFAAMGFTAVGVSGHSLTGPESVAIKNMTRFNEAASRQGLQTYVHGLKSRSLTSAAVAAGFSLIGGDAVVAATEGADGSFPFDIKDLYSPLVASLEGDAP